MSTAARGGGDTGDDRHGRQYRIDELAREAGTTVRNVRAYQDRGLLPPPRREGRVAWYSDAHLARLRLVGGLLDRGYTLANIAELVRAWEQGQDVGALLGLEAALGGAWASGVSAAVRGDELARMFGAEAARLLPEALDVGLLAPDGPDRYRVLNPAGLEIGALLSQAGVPLDAVMDSARRMRDAVDDLARQFVTLVERYVFEPPGEPLPRAELRRLAQLVDQLRPLATQVVETELVRAMERHVHERFGEYLERFARSIAGDTAGGQPGPAAG